MQLDLFGEHVRFAADVPAGSDPRRAVETALSAATGAFEDTPPGPVQLNLAFRDPLVPAPGDRLPPESGRRVYRAPRGPLALDFPPASRPACRNGAPWCWQGTTPARSPKPSPAPTACRCWPSRPPTRGSGRTRWDRTGLLLDAFGPDSAQPIERVVLFGRPTLSRPVSALLARADVPSALYQPVPVAWYEPGRRTELPLDNLADLADFAGRGSAAWLDAWLLAGAAAQHAVDQVLSGSAAALTGPAVGALVWEHSRGQLVLGSSNGIRDVDLAGAPAPEPGAVVFANRGLSGIDGTLATATGIALGGRQETTVLLGDVTFLHDAGGLLLGAGEEEPTLRIVVLNDAGGAIFGLLEHGAVEAAGRYGTAVERLFGTPHSVDLAALAAAYGVAHRCGQHDGGARRGAGGAVGGAQHHRGEDGAARAAGAAPAHQGRRGRCRGRSPRRGIGPRREIATETDSRYVDPRSGCPNTPRMLCFRVRDADVLLAVRRAKCPGTRLAPGDALLPWRGANFPARPYTCRVRAFAQRRTGTASHIWPVHEGTCRPTRHRTWRCALSLALRKLPCAPVYPPRQGFRVRAQQEARRGAGTRVARGAAWSHNVNRVGLSTWSRLADRVAAAGLAPSFHERAA